MKFKIIRASEAGNEPKPCKNAYGTTKLWYIDISSLDDLMELIKEVGRLVIESDSIIIYDMNLEDMER